MALGIYHNPEIWFGNRPTSSQIPLLFDEIINEKEFDTLRISITRDGLFTFDFSAWPVSIQEPIERRIKQVEIINTYLLCFYSALASRGLWIEDNRRSIPMMRADHSNLLGIVGASKAGLSSAGLSGDMLRVIARRRELANLALDL